MRKVFGLAALIILFTSAATLLLAQTGNLLIPIWTGTRYAWLVLGKSFSTTGGVLDVVQPPAKTRVYGAKLKWDAAAGGYPLPPGASAVAVYVNGIRHTSPEDYSITGGVVIPGPGGNWPTPADAVVVADHDQQ